MSKKFQKGDRVILRGDVLQRHARSVPAHLGYTHEQFEWRNVLDNLEGKIGVIERTFPNSKHVNVQFHDGTLIGINDTELEPVKSNPKRKKFHPPYEVRQWFERDRQSVVVIDRDDKTVAEWWDEAVSEMVEDGFFKIGGRGRRDEPIDNNSVIEYLQDMGVI